MRNIQKSIPFIHPQRVGHMRKTHKKSNIKNDKCQNPKDKKRSILQFFLKNYTKNIQKIYYARMIEKNRIYCKKINLILYIYIVQSI